MNPQWNKNRLIYKTIIGFMEKIVNNFIQQNHFLLKKGVKSFQTDLDKGYVFRLIQKRSRRPKKA